ncbi:MAG: acyl-CoA thioester hydrolase [Gammaproteobacteria bacterium]
MPYHPTAKDGAALQHPRCCILILTRALTNALDCPLSFASFSENFNCHSAHQSIIETGMATGVRMFSTPITPRVSETDGSGHINNTVAPIWFEAGRKEIFRICNPDLYFGDWHLILAAMTVDYVAQVFWKHPAEVRTWVQRIGTKSFTVYEEIWQDERLCTKGTSTYVYFDHKAQQSQPIPAMVRGALHEHLYQSASAKGV